MVHGGYWRGADTTLFTRSIPTPNRKRQTGPPETLTDLLSGGGGSWSPNCTWHISTHREAHWLHSEGDLGSDASSAF